MTAGQLLPAVRPLRAGAEGSPVLAARGLTKRWEKRAPLFSGLDLDLRSSTIAAFTGVNGAGKTTLLRVLAGLIDPDAGVVTIDGLHPRRNRREYARRVGYLSATHGGLYARLKVAGHLDYWGRLSLLSAPERAERVAWALERFELRALADRRVDRISMGQRQRLRLALTFLHRPKAVLLDEPWNSLDDDGTRLLQDMLVEHALAGGVAVCCVPDGALRWSGIHATYAIGEGRVEQL
jgi:ABC-2 type transport system ATP-binding protein